MANTAKKTAKKTLPKTAKKTAGKPAKKQAADMGAQLLDAQVAYEMKRLTGKALESRIKKEVAAAYKYMNDIRMEDIAPKAHVKEVVKRIVVEMPISGGITELAGEMARQVLTMPVTSQTTLEEIFPKELFYGIMDRAASMETARKRRIQRALYTKAYFRIVADVVVTAVKDFLLEDNILVRKLPGMSLLMKTGRGAAGVAGRAIPSWILELESSLQETLEEKIETAIQENEGFFLEFFNAERLLEVSDEIWRNVSRVTLNEHFSAVGPDDMEDFIVLGFEFWLHFRETPYFESVYGEIVDSLYKKYGKRELIVLMDDLGITQEVVQREIIASSKAFMVVARKTGYLEERLRENLAPFYKSKAFAKVLEEGE